jgi:hypothetical protein
MILVKTKPILTMKKLLFTLSMITCFTVASMAQGRFSIGAEAALPMGDFGDVVGFGIGGTVRYEAPINDNLSWMGTVGFISFSEKDIDISGFTVATSATMIPIQGGIKYYFTESFNGFYAAGELGMHSVKVKAEADGISSDASDGFFSFAPSVGYHLGTIDISARYQLVEDADYLGFRIAYVLGGK